MEKAALDREFTQKLIDLLAEVTNLTIFLYIENVGVLYSKNMPSFCKKIRDEIDEGICSSLFPANLSSGELKMCHAGLWCRTIPLKIRDGSLAYFTVGHRRIKGKDDESEEKLEYLFDINAKNRWDRAQILDEFLKVQKVDEKDFYNPIFEDLLVMEKYLEKEHELIEEIKYRTSNLSHQLVLPIQALVAEAWLLKTNLKNDEDKQLAESIMKDLRKLSYIVENIEYGKRDIENIQFSKVDIFSVVMNITDLFQPEANKKGITIKRLEKSDVDSTGLIEASLPHMEHLFFNLMHNAVKYSYSSNESKNSYIEVAIDQVDNFYKIEISNHGIGILENEKEKIFQEGWRGELSKDKSRIGSGLGLAIVKRIVDLHRGKVEVDSQKIGRDDGDPQQASFVTRIKVYLPIKQTRDIIE